MKNELGIEEQIRKATTESLLEVGATEVNFAVEWPADMAHGDYAVNAALAAAKSLGKNPRELAGELTPLIQQKLGDLASNVEVAGPGFINITLASDTIAKEIASANELAERWGRNSASEGRRVIVEFSCPNPFKEMHVGHMMSTIIGESVARLIESSGAIVCRDTYGGDVGPHVAKALWGLRKAGITEPSTAEEIGKAYAEGTRAYDESEESKKEIDELNVAIYKGEDHELMELWRKGREVSIEEFQDLYRLLNTHFDYFFYESDVALSSMRIVEDGIERGVFEESDGAIIFNGERRGEEAGLHTLVFVTSRGTPTYEAKDIGLAFLKEERWPSDESIILTAAEQIGHFKIFLAALSEIAPLVAAKTRHLPHGFLRLTTGKMSSREGNIVTTAGLIKDVTEAALTRSSDPLIAEQVAMAAIKYSILKSSAGSDIIFDPEKSLSLEGDSGPYLQYAVARTKSVIAQAESENEAETENSAPTDASEPAEPYLIERLIVRFPEVVVVAQKNLAPHTIAQYLTTLAGEWNSFYAQNRIRGGEHETYKLRLAEAFVTTMTNGMNLLGIPVLEKM
jgi:arginyl-tRNA synthetase